MLRNSNACGTSLTIASFSGVGYLWVDLRDREILCTELHFVTPRLPAPLLVKSRALHICLQLHGLHPGCLHTLTKTNSFQRTLPVYGVSQRAVFCHIKYIGNNRHFPSLLQEKSGFHPGFSHQLTARFFPIPYMQLVLEHGASRGG